MIKSNFMPCGATGAKGDNGITPHIGSNGNWYIGTEDTGFPSRGERGQRGFRGEQGVQGEKGEKGEKGNYVEVVNNFTGGVDKALSAEKGKELNERVSQIETLTPVWQSFEETGSVTVNNSINGFTKDLIIKGKTIYNSGVSSNNSSGEKEGNKILLKSIGQNINPEIYETGSINLSTGQDTETSTTFRSVGYIKVSENFKYYINKRMVIYFYNKDKGFIKGESINTDNFLTPSSCEFIRFRSFTEDNTTDFSKINFMISKGVKATNYEQFRSKLIEISLPFQKGLKSSSDGSVCDVIKGNTGEIIQRISDEYTVLSKPVIHKINNIQMATFDETTHITQENSVLSNIGFKAKISLASQIKGLNNEINNVRKENELIKENMSTLSNVILSLFNIDFLPVDDEIINKIYKINNKRKISID